jgi:hypothetical protein
MRSHLAIGAAMLVVLSTMHAEASSRLNQLPDVDPEVQQPGMELPRSAVPRPSTPAKKPAAFPDAKPLPPGAVIASPEPQKSPPVARPAQPPMAIPGIATARRVGPPSTGVPALPMRVEPSPEQIAGLFVNAVIQIINATRR